MFLLLSLSLSLIVFFNLSAFQTFFLSILFSPKVLFSLSSPHCVLLSLYCLSFCPFLFFCSFTIFHGSFLFLFFHCVPLCVSLSFFSHLFFCHSLTLSFFCHCLFMIFCSTPFLWFSLSYLSLVVCFFLSFLILPVLFLSFFSHSCMSQSLFLSLCSSLMFFPPFSCLTSSFFPPFRPFGVVLKGVFQGVTFLTFFLCLEPSKKGTPKIRCNLVQ